MRKILLGFVGLFIATLTFGQSDGEPGKMEDPVGYINKESIGGKLDFNLTLEKENKTFYLYDGIAYNKKDFAIFLWGQAVRRLGIESGKKAAKLWTEINERELTGPERKALTRGVELEMK
jgi:hypothetical protein